MAVLDFSISFQQTLYRYFPQVLVLFSLFLLLQAQFHQLPSFGYAIVETLDGHKTASRMKQTMAVL